MTDKDRSKRPGGKPETRKFKNDGPKSASKAEKSATRQRDPDPRMTDEPMKPERISKLLARAGIASRRDVERMIMDGRVALNGKLLDTPVVNATLADRIEVDGEPIRGIERTRLWLYHKPAGLVTTNSDPEGRPTVFENLPDELPRVMSIGRLDINTEGLLLLTNDGGLARVLELPTTGWLRRYRVRAHGAVDQAALDKLKDGIAVDGVLYGAIEATLDRVQGHNVWITMGLREGKNREIKNVLGALGLDVNRLIRISYGPFQLGDLPEGEVQEVRGRMLRDQLGPRLIEDAKANFDAPVYSAAGGEEEAVSAKPSARSGWAEDESRDTRSKPQRGKPEHGKSEHGRARGGDDRRERALDRLDTKRDGGKRDNSKRDGGKRDFGGFDDAPKRKPAGQNRTANVWMAPGARPLGEKQAAAKAKAEKSGKGPRRDPRGMDEKVSAFREGDRGLRVTVSRTRDEDGEWIRAEAPARKPKEDDGFGQKRGFGARPARRDGEAGGGFGERRGGRFGDRDGDDRRDSRRGGEDRREGGRFERGERGGDKPFRGKPSGPRAEGDRSFGERSGGERSERSRPAGGKPFGAKPSGGKSFGGKPSGGKSFGGKPGGGRPGGGKPSGRSGGKPGAGKGPGGPRGKR
ncbi:rRNA pseudouridine synthase [Allorhizobium sp. BGMRC 0089]|uniref:pseudouridine synthase n=1 Tax=Allorhizobium sonneratiae TaxID=2934936 RepID=UPI002033560D|nr:pseudouridine synthase [Allorhizobium sonneratiae]MCM2291325.1 rRNA pseudouridine synthase [Allorhizobium sonneratiae]